MRLLINNYSAYVVEKMQNHENQLGVFVTPTTYAVPKLIQQNLSWAADNGAYTGFDMQKFTVMLDKLIPYQETCIFVTMPDVVSDHQQTIKMWNDHYSYIAKWGYPLAFVCQDGCVMDEIPWDLIAAIFIGGSDKFKDSQSVSFIQRAKALDKWVHVGRVNTRRRVHYCLKMGVNSIDGTRWNKYSSIDLWRYFLWKSEIKHQMVLSM